jgi:hypothetical protein
VLIVESQVRLLCEFWHGTGKDGSRHAMPDDLPVDVLTELGRVTWAAIKLEDYTEDLCSHIEPVNPQTDRRPVRRKIRDAKKILDGRVPFAMRDDAVACWSVPVRRSSNITPLFMPRPLSGSGAGSALSSAWASARCLVRAAPISSGR